MRMNQLLEELESNLCVSSASALPVQQALCTPATDLNPEFLQHSLRHPLLSSNLGIKLTPGFRLNSVQDPRQGMVRESETHLQCDHLRAPITDSLRSQRSVSPSGQLEEVNSSHRCSLHMPEAAMGHLREYTKAPKPFAVASQATSLQASLVQPQPERNPKPFGSVPQKPAAYRFDVQLGGVPYQGGHSHLSSIFQQHNGSDHQ